MRYLYGLVALCALSLSGCASPEPKPPPGPQMLPPIAVGPNPEIPGVEQCGAEKFQSLIGRSRYDIPVPVHPENQRVACTTCAMTMDYNPKRLNFMYDAETGLIKQVNCG
jgi:hypothetical protein